MVLNRKLVLFGNDNVLNLTLILVAFDMIRYVIKSIMKFDPAINNLQENFYNSRPDTQDTES